MADYTTSCIKCKDMEARPFLVEPIKCNKCDDITYIIYFKCSKCNTVWKSVNDVVVSFIHAIDLDKLPIIQDLADTINKPKVIPSNFKITPEVDSMVNLVTKCIRCNSIAFEIEEGIWKCPKCNFEWDTQKGIN